MKRTAVVLALVMLLGVVGHAQVAVFDAAVTFRNSVTAVIEEALASLERVQRLQLVRMAQRLSALDLARYRLPDSPRWRTHGSDTDLFATAYISALYLGDARGSAYLGVAQPVLDAAAALRSLPSTARRVLLAQLATLDAADATIIAGTNDTGRLRFTGRRELQAIDTLDRDVTNGSLEQSTTALLDKISGASLIAAGQRQAREQLLNGVVEQLLLDSKRARDTEAAAMNMQLVAWRDRSAANAAFVAGSGEALRAWRQP
ncbi:MAG: hypothetical protein ABIX28_20270 [Vicinamibacterales bacterium]